MQLTEKEKTTYIEIAFKYWRKKGFPYSELSRAQIKNQFLRLKATESEKIFIAKNQLQASTVGLGLANYYHPHMWSVKCSRYQTPLECFDNDAMLRGSITKALTLWPDRKGASPSILRKILATYRDTRRVSNFRPAVAKAIYEKYSKPSSRILDFSAGFGGRLLGCLALDRFYVGYDPSENQISGNSKMVNDLSCFGVDPYKVQLHKVCAEDAMKNESPNTFDLIFTSPPYFNTEKYSSEKTQSFIRYPDYSSWREEFLLSVIKSSFRILRRNGLLILNVANVKNAQIAEDTIRFASKYFILLDQYFMRMGVLPFNKTNRNGTAYKFEPIFIFRKYH